MPQLTHNQAIQYSNKAYGADLQDEAPVGDDDASGYDEDFVGSGVDSESDEEAPATPPGELADTDTRGKKSKGIASQGMTPARKSFKAPKQIATPKGTATPKQTVTPKKTAALKKTATPKTAAPKPAIPRKAPIRTSMRSAVVPPVTPVNKKSGTPKQSSTGKYADLKRAVRPKKVAEGKTVKKPTSIDTADNQIPSQPKPTEAMATSPSANIGAPTAPAPKKKTHIPTARKPKKDQDQTAEARPASLPSRPLFTGNLDPLPMWPSTIDPGLISTSPQQATGSLPPPHPSLPPRPPAFLPRTPSRSSFQPGGFPINYMPNMDPNYQSNIGLNYQPAPSYFSPSTAPNNFTTGVDPYLMAWQTAARPSAHLSALPTNGNSPLTAAFLGQPPATQEQPQQQPQQPWFQPSQDHQWEDPFLPQ